MCFRFFLRRKKHETEIDTAYNETNVIPEKNETETKLTEIIAKINELKGILESHDMNIKERFSCASPYYVIWKFHTIITF